MSGDAIERLRAALGPESVNADAAGIPRVTPVSESSLRLACQVANEAGWRLRVEGQGTWLPADAPADLIVSLRGLDQVESISAADLVASVQAGVKIGDLRRQLAEAGAWLAIDPPGKPERTLGSVVATATAGPLRARFGQIRDHVIGCSVVTADGRLVQAGGQVVKNVAGFDLTKLQVGGFGGFGIITTVNLRLRAQPRADATALARGPRDQLTAAGRSILEGAVEVAALELLSPVVAAEPEWVLAARVVGSEALVQSEVPRLTATTDLQWETVSGERGAALWRLVAGSTGAAPVSFRLGVLVDGLDDTIDLLTHDLDDGLITAGAASGGLRWTGHATPDQLRRLRQGLAQQEIPLTLERAPWPVRKAVGHFGAYREGVGRIVGRLRRTFDPDERLSVALERADG
ncbi:MAG: FAD-binding oxidoreductase [Gemmatimonadales bacterium]